MTVLSSNIKKIRTIKNISQAKFAELFGITRASVGAYEEGRAKPKMELLLKIANYISIPVEDFITREMTVNEISRFNSINEKYLRKQKTSTIDKLKQSEIHFIDKNMLTAFISSENIKSFVRRQPIITFPFILKKIKLALEIVDATIKIEDKSVKNNNIILCEKLDADSLIKLDKVHLFLITYKKKAHVAFFNVDSKKKTIYTDEIKKTFDIASLENYWRIEGIINFNMQPPAMLEKRISDLEASFHRLNKYLGKE